MRIAATTHPAYWVVKHSTNAIAGLLPRIARDDPAVWLSVLFVDLRQRAKYPWTLLDSLTVPVILDGFQAAIVRWPVLVQTIRIPSEETT